MPEIVQRNPHFGNGGGGTDTSVFEAAADAVASISRRDVILDFLAFSFIGGAAFSGKAGELHAIRSGASTIIEGDTDGNGRADFQIALKDMLATLQAGDFIL